MSHFMDSTQQSLGDDKGSDLHPAYKNIIRKLYPIQVVIDHLRDQIDLHLNRIAFLEVQVRELRQQLEVVKRREKERKAL